MNRPFLSVSFLPQNIVVSAHAGDTLLDAALDNGIPLCHECGGNCDCTTCHVIVEAGETRLSVMEEVEKDRLTSAEGVTPHSRLSCQAILLGGEVTVRIAEETNAPCEYGIGEGTEHGFARR